LLNAVNSPALKIGKTLEILSASGKTPVAKELFTRLESGVKMIAPTDLIILFEISS